ncbi:MAG: hypothetical protein AAF552_16605 [Pseudomonadota bacterium]
MKNPTRQTLIIPALIALGLLATAPASSADVDPAWLASWQEAQKQRPQRLPNSGRIAPAEEPGSPLLIQGLVLNPNGSPASGVAVHAYHRDSAGYEFGKDQKASKTWRLQGWVKTDSAGVFRFETIRPAADHLGREPGHIHFTLDSAEFGRQWAPKVFFSDDPQVSTALRKKSDKAGDLGNVRAVKMVDEVQTVGVRFKLKRKADF